MMTDDVRKSWRAVAANMTTKQLCTIHQALLWNDKRLAQCCTTRPAPVHDDRVTPCDAACLISFPFAFENDTPKSTLATSVYFATFSYLMLTMRGGADDFNAFLGWYDRTTREEMRRDLLPEVAAVIVERSKVQTVKGS